VDAIVVAPPAAAPPQYGAPAAWETYRSGNVVRIALPKN
jgi:hypothetical protein